MEARASFPPRGEGAWYRAGEQEDAHSAPTRIDEPSACSARLSKPLAGNAPPPCCVRNPPNAFSLPIAIFARPAPIQEVDELVFCVGWSARLHCRTGALHPRRAARFFSHAHGRPCSHKWWNCLARTSCSHSVGNLACRYRARLEHRRAARLAIALIPGSCDAIGHRAVGRGGHGGGLTARSGRHKGRSPGLGWSRRSRHSRRNWVIQVAMGRSYSATASPCSSSVRCHHSRSAMSATTRSFGTARPWLPEQFGPDSRRQRCQAQPAATNLTHDPSD